MTTRTTRANRRVPRILLDDGEVRRPAAKSKRGSRKRDELGELLEALRSLEGGDFEVTLPARNGRMGEVFDAFNRLAARNRALAEEAVRLERVVGREGRMAERATLMGASGGWATLVHSLNALIADLVQPTSEVARVLVAVAEGDLTQKMALELDGQPVKGEFLRIGTAVNSMVDQLRSFASEVTRVAKEVGSDGKLGGQANVPGAAGIWRDLTDNVNQLAANLTAQVRNIAEVTTAVARGDLSKKITVDVRGEILELKNTINVMVDQLNSFASEVTRVAREVGTEGELGGQADVRGVSGTWKDLTDNVNGLAKNLTDQVRNIAKVTTAVANGDLSQKITVEARGEILELKNTINTMVDQLRSFASEVTRVAKQVGTEGKLGAQADVKGVSGTWKDLTDNVNQLADNLTAQVRNIAEVTTAVARGDLSRKISVDVKGEILELKNTINTMVDQLNSFASEVVRVAKEVGTEGKLGGQADVKGVAGVWKDLTDNVNFMASNLTTQVRGIVKVVTAVANGDLKQQLKVDAKGEIAALADTINGMTDTLSTFAEQVSTVAREVGVEGKLGGQARVPGVAGTWRDLTENVNFMASNLTTQVRGIVKVVTAVANGDLTQKLVGVEAKGEIAALADTINNMTDTLSTFAEQVSTVAREVGIEGMLGGQARVPGAQGTWRQLTDNVNQLAGNLTTQVRAISEVATAVTKGDLTRSITVDAEGEVAKLKDNINQMIVNLKETTQKNAEQDWLKTNLARFGAKMQGLKSLDAASRLIMSELTPLVSAHLGAFYLVDSSGPEPLLKMAASYAFRERKTVGNVFRLGEGLVGQCALERKPIMLTNVPSQYIRISSALGEAPPLNIIVLPVLFEGEVKAVIELGSFNDFSTIHQIFLDQLTETIGVVINMIIANMRTEELLQQSQKLANELQSQSRELTGQQQELRRTNAELEAQALELEEKAKQLEKQNRKIEEKNGEVERARLSLEEKAEQLSLISRYKSEFLANMSHELRTPLNSLLILAKLLGENREGHLTSKEVDYAQTIHASGEELLQLINEILDLARVEAGKMRIEPRELPLSEIVEFVERSFRPVADSKRLRFVCEADVQAVPRLSTDPQRLQQVLKNLLSNAFKFTEEGQVRLRIRAGGPDEHFRSPELATAAEVVAFEVEDTGIGIAPDKQELIFEAFQQADGTTSRKYGGTGLGLSISREIARLLGGEIHVKSEPGKGSTFILFLPSRCAEIEEPVAPFDGEGATALGSECPVPAGEAEPPRALVEGPPRNEGEPLSGRKVLIVDDDVRNIFALTSALESRGMEIVYAENGTAGLATLKANADVAAVLMDVMMPGIDGYETIRTIRSDPGYEGLPIIAVTAKALAEDRQRCLDAGASDYLPKPVDTERLFALLREWMGA